MFSIIYDDGDLIAINKPSGWAVHNSKKVGDAPVILQALSIQLESYLYPLHRLDQPTSGVLLFCRTQIMAGLMSECFRENKVTKEYLCISRGWLLEKLEFDKALKNENGKNEGDAKTIFNPIAYYELPIENQKFNTTRLTLIEAFPKTGKYHQIRRHLNSLGFPIIGDTMHGDLRINRLLAKEIQSHRLFLHAKKIDFIINNKIYSIEAKLPDDLAKVLNNIFEKSISQ